MKRSARQDKRTYLEQLTAEAECCGPVIHEGKLTEPFSVQTGVRQCCLLSPIVFLMVVDWVMRQSTVDQKTGIQWTFNKQLEDLDFADDISFFFSQAARCTKETVLWQKKLKNWTSNQYWKDKGHESQQQKPRFSETTSREN